MAELDVSRFFFPLSVREETARRLREACDGWCHRTGVMPGPLEVAELLRDVMGAMNREALNPCLIEAADLFPRKADRE